MDGACYAESHSNGLFRPQGTYPQTLLKVVLRDTHHAVTSDYTHVKEKVLFAARAFFPGIYPGMLYVSTLLVLPMAAGRDTYSSWQYDLERYAMHTDCSRT